MQRVYTVDKIKGAANVNRCIIDKIEELGCRVFPNEPLCGHTSFRIGGPADCFVITETQQQFMDVWTLCRAQNVPLFVIGNGSNLLVSDEGVEGVVLQLPSSQPPVFNGDTVTAFGGMSLGKLCLAACENGLSGLEFAYGIPGTVGGGVYMNAGAYGGEMADVIESVTVLCDDGTTMVLNNAQMCFGYRHSVCMEKPYIVLSVTLRLTPGEKETIRSKMDEFLSRRKEKQPLEYPSGGSFFKRPAGYFAGALIEQSGLKGASVGGAQISEKHAGFLINRGGATCRDVMQLSEYVQQVVLEKHGVLLQCEVQKIGR